MRRRRAWSTFANHRGALAASGALLAIVLLGVGAGVLAVDDPARQFRDAMLAAPSMQGHWLGTDELGRDMLSRLLFGARVTLGIAFAAVTLAVVPGVALGLVAASYPRSLGNVILRSADVLQSLPTVLLAVAVVAVLGPGTLNTVLAIAVSSLPTYVRLVRASALGELAKPYAMSVRAVGAGPLRLMLRNVLPNCLGPVIVNATLDISSAILTTAGLGFLGLGAQPPAPEWGTMLANARDFIGRAWWMVAWPGLAILVTVLCATVVGDALGDAQDPRRGEQA